jgi:hypothetical protein
MEEVCEFDRRISSVSYFNNDAAAFPTKAAFQIDQRRRMRPV